MTALLFILFFFYFYTDSFRERKIIRLLSVLKFIEQQLSGLENRDYGRRGSAALTMRHPSIRRSWH
jgi:hypothetical protein